MPGIELAEIVKDLAFPELFLGEGNVVIEIEIAAEGRDPGKSPAHARFVALDLGKRRARHREQRHIVMLEMRQGTVEMVGEERAAGAARGPAWAEHEMIDDELAAAAE